MPAPSRSPRRPRTPALGLVAVLAALAAGAFLLSRLGGEEPADDPGRELAAPAPPPSPADPPPREEVRRAPVGDPARTSASRLEPARAEGTRAVRVRSEAGLAIHGVLVRLGAGDDGAAIDRWIERVVVDGVARIEGGARDLRAPGHLTVPLGAGLEEVALVPDALVVVEGPRARARILNAQVGHDLAAGTLARLDGAAVWGFVSDTRWALAVDTRESTPLLGRELEVQLDLLSGTRLRLEVQLAAGMRVVVPLPDASAAVETAPLELSLRRADGEPIPRAEVVVVAEGRLAHEHLQGAEGRGGANVDLRLTPTRRELEARDGRCVVPDLPVGGRTRAFAREVASGDAAQLDFEHDGSARELVLANGRRITGRLAPPRGQPMPPVADFGWYVRGRVLTNRFVHVGGEVPEAEPLRGGAPALRIAADGRFEIATPMAPFLEDDDPASETLLVDVHAGGYERVRVEVASAGREVIDLGTIPLAPRVPDWVVAPPLEAFLRECGPGDLVRSRSDRSALAHVLDDARLRADGALELRSRRRRDAAGRWSWYVYDAREHTYSWYPVDPRSAPAITIARGETGVALAQRRDRRYARVPTTVRRLIAEPGELPPGAVAVDVAWTWRGVEVPFARLQRGAEARALELELPAEEVRIAWRLVRPPGGGALEMQTGTVEVPGDGRLRVP